MIESHILGPLAAFGSSLTWAIASTWYSEASQKYSGFSVNFTRALVALPLSVASAFIFAGGWSEGLALYQGLQWPQVGWLALSMAAAYGVGDASFFAASRTLGLPAALAIASCFPVWTLVAGFLWLNQVPTLQQLLGLLISVTGISLVILLGRRSLPSTEPVQPHEPERVQHANSNDDAVKPRAIVSSNPVRLMIPGSGVGLALLASIAWAINSFASSRGGVGISPHVGNSVRMLSALFFSGVLGRIFAPHSPRTLPLKAALSMGWILIVEAYGGAFFYVYGLSHSPLALGAVLTSLAPIVSLPVSVVLGLEELSWARVLGVCLSVLGVCLLIL